MLLRRFRTAAAIAAAVPAALLVSAPTASAADRVETPIVSSSPQTDVAASLVKIRVPLPASFAAHPEACDWVQYLRFRSADGPAKSTDSDSVTLLMPGILEGAAAFDPLARNSVREAKRRGRSIEVWAMDRRANCMEDLTGVNAAEQSGNLTDATNYYFKGAEIGGQKFAGFKPDDRWLSDLGLAQTVKDYYSVLTEELPDQQWREQHVLCGGHSLGGPLTHAFAGWDFDGSTKTTTDAGYRQCAGFVGFESWLDLDPTQDSKLLKSAIQLFTLGQADGLRKTTTRLLRAGKAPRTLPLSGADPLSTTVLELIATAASKEPNAPAQPLIDSIPRGGAVEEYFHTQGSASVLRLLASKDSIRDYRYTNAGLLGQLLDDNGAQFTGVRMSFGFPDGGRLRRSRIPDEVAPIPGLNIMVQKNPLFLPFKYKQGDSLVGWRNYNDLQPHQIGPGRTNPNTEVTDARDVARLMHEGPTNFTEGYFPTRLMIDLIAFWGHDTRGEMSGFKYRHPMAKKPRMAANGTSGPARKAGFSSPDPQVWLQGYEHADAITAAEIQNDGKPEGASQMLVDMVDKVVPR